MIEKAGIVFNMSVYTYVCICANKPKNVSGYVSFSVVHHVSDCKYFGRCLYVYLFC